MRRRYWLFVSAVIATLCLAGSPVESAPAESNNNQPFGLVAVEAPDTPLSLPWTKVLREAGGERRTIAHCRAEPSACSSVAAKFLSIVQNGDRQDGRRQIAHINRAANAALRALTAAQVDNEWRPALDALAKGTGDCKHYAMLKYAALSEAGIAPEALKIVVVEVHSSHEQHAMVAVRLDGRWLLLDNRSSMLIESAKALDYYDPLYELDQNGVHQFALAARPLQIARSDRPVYEK